MTTEISKLAEKTEAAEKITVAGKTEIAEKTKTSGKNETTGKRSATRLHRRLTEKEEYISVVFAAADWVLQLEGRDPVEIQTFVQKMMALTKYSQIFTKPFTRYVVERVLTFIAAVRLKESVKKNGKSRS